MIFLNRDDRRALGLEDCGQVDVTSHFEGQERTMTDVQVVPYPIARRSAAMYFPEANVPRAGGQRGGGQQHPDLEVGSHHARPFGDLRTAIVPVASVPPISAESGSAR